MTDPRQPSRSMLPADARAVRAEERWAVAALGAVILITLGWWALALWPLSASAPEWLVRTREVCFGTRGDGLPPPGGWILVFGQPIGMFVVLIMVWGGALQSGLRRWLRSRAGAVTAGLATVALLTGLGGVGWRVATAEQAPALNAAASNAPRPGRIVVLNDSAPTLSLVNQRGEAIALEQFRSRRVIVTFAFAHCEAICPTLVHNARDVRRREADDVPVLLVVTLDPWRDTPARLPAIAGQWNLGADEHVLSGSVEAVEATLNAWKVPRVRNRATGELIHPSVTYLVGPQGELAYATDGTVAGVERALALLGSQRE